MYNESIITFTEIFGLVQLLLYRPSNHALIQT
jgi:hypothetical protein